MTEESRAAPRWRALSPHVIAVAVFLVATAAVFGELFQRGASTAVPVRPGLGPIGVTTRSDASYITWLVDRNARILSTRPHRIFDAELCAPTEKALAYCVPAIAQGILAIPGSLLTHEPILVYNLSLVAVVLLGCFAMYLLVAHWTGVAAAGIAAGLLFAFMPLRLGNLTHPTAWDISWTVLAFFFAERLFAHGRWRDALGLATATALQIAADFYPLVAATFLSLPLLAWMAWRHRLRAARPEQLAFVAIFVLLAAGGVLLPYLGAESELGSLQRVRFRYFSWSGLVRPSALPFPGWSVVALALVAMFAGRKRAAPGTGGDPRWALLAGALLVGAIAAGPNNPGLPNLHTLLATWIPGLDAVRGIFRLSIGIQLALIVLAGLGAGALIRATRGRARRIAEIALVAIAAFDVLRLPAAGLERRYAFGYESIRPDADSIAFFAELERRGNHGPMLELPELFMTGATRRILLGGWHERRTSACYGSFRPAGQQELVELAAELPSPEALDRLRSLGFTTVILHLDDQRRAARAIRERIESAGRDEARIVPVYVTSKRVAYELLPGDEPDSAEETR